MNLYLFQPRRKKRKVDFELKVAPFTIDEYIDIIEGFIATNKYSIDIALNNSIDLMELVSKLRAKFDDYEISIGLAVDDISSLDYYSFELEDAGVFICHPIASRCLGVCDKESLQTPRSTPIKRYKSRDIYCAPKFKLDEDFKTKLVYFCNKCGRSNPEIYNGGGITRQVFSKATSNNDYIPKKPTIVSLIIGMRLCLDDALDLLNAAGYTLSNSILFDSIIKELLLREEYDLMKINDELYSNGLPILGWAPRENK